MRKQNKRQKVVRTYTAKPDKKNGYAGKFPIYYKCKLHYTCPCTVKCNNFNRVGHMTRNYRTTVPATTQRSPVENQKIAWSGTDIKEMDKNKDKTGQNRAREWKEREKTSPAVPADLIGPARNPLNGPGQPIYSLAQAQIIPAHYQASPAA
ncbi:hypothetical protein Tco_0644769 [Tanacetum coccineum]